MDHSYITSVVSPGDDTGKPSYEGALGIFVVTCSTIVWFSCLIPMWFMTFQFARALAMDVIGDIRRDVHVKKDTLIGCDVMVWGAIVRVPTNSLALQTMVTLRAWEATFVGLFLSCYASAIGTWSSFQMHPDVTFLALIYCTVHHVATVLGVCACHGCQRVWASFQGPKQTSF
jgi:hypothetical protein